MRDISVSFTGNVATAPTFVSGSTRGGSGTIFFRVAVNPSWFDRARGEWAEKTPEFFSVFVRGQQADNVYDSIHPGEPVFVAGRLSSGEYPRKDSGEIVHANTVNAETVGHALTFGTTKWTKVTRDSASTPDSETPGAEGSGSDSATESGEPPASAVGDDRPASIITSVSAEEPAGVSAAGGTPSGGGTDEAGKEDTPF